MNNYIIPSDNWEQQQPQANHTCPRYYIIPSDNWEQQPVRPEWFSFLIISYQAITGNNNTQDFFPVFLPIISYQAITGNNNIERQVIAAQNIISYQAITGNNNLSFNLCYSDRLYHTCLLYTSVRIDVFCEENKGKKKYYFVPIYTADVVNRFLRHHITAGFKDASSVLDVYKRQV